MQKSFLLGILLTSICATALSSHRKRPAPLSGSDLLSRRDKSPERSPFSPERLLSAHILRIDGQWPDYTGGTNKGEETPWSTPDLTPGNASPQALERRETTATPDCYTPKATLSFAPLTEEENKERLRILAIIVKHDNAARELRKAYDTKK